MAAFPRSEEGDGLERARRDRRGDIPVWDRALKKEDLPTLGRPAER